MTKLEASAGRMPSVIKGYGLSCVGSIGELAGVGALYYLNPVRAKMVEAAWRLAVERSWGIGRGISRLGLGGFSRLPSVECGPGRGRRVNQLIE